MAGPERFELPTYSFVGCHSIQLSYGPAPKSPPEPGEREISTRTGASQCGVQERPPPHFDPNARGLKLQPPCAPYPCSIRPLAARL